ncbi:1828_t:CDS:2 [Entrophospora sp. SA101]|nr:1828_t:CDS:2 [Entrophospora sp. SA101]
MPLLISFEGIDGSGKTSLVEKLSQKLPDSFITKEPRGTELGKRTAVRTGKIIKGNETYEAVAFVGKEEVISLEERIERKLNSFINIKKLIQKAGKDNNEIMEKLTKLEEQVELIKQDLKENTTNNEWQKSRIQREKERVEERLNKYSQLKAGNYYHFHLKMKEKKGETYYVLLDFQEVNRGN